MVAWCLPFSHCIAHWPHYYWRWSQVKSRGSLFTSGSKLNVPRDSMACLDHVTLPKRTHYGTCKSKKLHTARPTAPATSPAGEANPVYACTPSSKAMAARGVPHGIMRACALTTGTLRAASACDVAIARTGRATTLDGAIVRDTANTIAMSFDQDLVKSFVDLHRCHECVIPESTDREPKVASVH